MRSVDLELESWEYEELPNRPSSPYPLLPASDWWIEDDSAVDQALAVFLHKRPSIGRVLARPTTQ